jgi:hypothetical protein
MKNMICLHTWCFPQKKVIRTIASTVHLSTTYLLYHQRIIVFINTSYKSHRLILIPSGTMISLDNFYTYIYFIYYVPISKFFWTRIADGVITYLSSLVWFLGGQRSQVLLLSPPFPIILCMCHFQSPRKEVTLLNSLLGANFRTLGLKLYPRGKDPLLLLRTYLDGSVYPPPHQGDIIMPYMA